MSSYTGFTFHRKFRGLSRKSKLWRAWTINYLNRHIFGSWQKLGKVRWTFLAWIFIVMVSLWGTIWQLQGSGLSSQIEKPVRGGLYREAILGQAKSINPLFPESSASADVSSLVFSGLTKINGRREIMPDLAERWDISSDRKVYTFFLRPNLVWQDGVKLTTQDIAFTIDRVKNPDTRSTFAPNWSGVEYTIVDDRTIRFNLPSSYGNFLSNTTLGIVPKHKLEIVTPSNMRSSEFNQKPVGSGPYKLNLLEVDSTVIDLVANEKYYIHEPYIPKIRIELFQEQNQMVDALIRRQVDAISQVSPSDVSTVEKIEGIINHRIGLPAYVGAFFNLSSPVLSNLALRQALAYSVDRDAIVKDILKGEGVQSYYPIPAGFAGFNPLAAKYDFDYAKAKELFSAPVTTKQSIRIVTLDNQVYKNVANYLAESWRKLGLNVEVIAAGSVELQQNYIRSRNYDVLLYGQNLGVDSDVYSFWHSSQISDPGLNVSLYKNSDVDKFLEAGRLAKDPVYKASRYSAFVEQWAKDLPAVVLYSPYYNYPQSELIAGFDANKIAEPSNRFYNIYDWYIKPR